MTTQFRCSVVANICHGNERCATNEQSKVEVDQDAASRGEKNHNNNNKNENKIVYLSSFKHSIDGRP